MEPISESVSTCFQVFAKLAEDVGAGADGLKAAIVRLLDEQNRFKVWSNNIGAQRSGRNSLDYRLKDASHLSTVVIKLLASLTESLSEGKPILKDTRTLPPRPTRN